jgi:hypothetical protein
MPTAAAPGRRKEPLDRRASVLRRAACDRLHTGEAGHAPYWTGVGRGVAKVLNLTDPFAALLVVLTILQIKHAICDYPLQNLYQLQNKGTYGHPGGFLHAGLHVIGTATVFLAVTPTLWLGAAILVGEFVFHYHVDWAKDKWIKARGYTPVDREFWWAIGFDQLLHHLSYIVIAAVLVGVMIGTT